MSQTTNQPRRLLACWAALFAVLACGCTSKPESMVEVHGKVNVDGVPFAEGLITFVPMESTAGAKISAPIESGVYKIGTDQGLHVGQYAVEIYGMPDSVKAMINNQPIEHKKSTNYREIAAEFNSQTKLQAVLGSGVNEHSFDVKFR